VGCKTEASEPPQRRFRIRCHRREGYANDSVVEPVVKSKKSSCVFRHVNGILIEFRAGLRRERNRSEARQGRLYRLRQEGPGFRSQHCGK